MRDIIARRLSKKMCSEFTNFIRTKGLMDKTAEYLPRLLEWVGDKIIFWQSELGSNLVRGCAKIGVKHSLAVTASAEKSLIILEIIIQKIPIRIKITMLLINLIRKGWVAFFVKKEIMLLYLTVANLKTIA